jgi:small subunit ribosomal protein S8
MSHTDPIADMLTRINNAAGRGKSDITMPSSRIKLEIARLMKQHGFIKNYEYVQKEQKDYLNIKLSFLEKTSAIQGVKRVSTPGRRHYLDAEGMKKFSRGNKVTIVTTSHGVMTAAEASAKQIGGEVICSIW